jgi:rhamnose utilization protein RhaD (predicted bifunctional aldolase and dehydrogenase)/NAD(P)-dependent dehydrogenase (short-subunit alcohol dehydrogenase family)
MQSLWNEKEARKFIHDPIALRVYTSRLLGQNSDLVLHGGGNTSVKVNEKNAFGDKEEILYIKGSGWDLATLQAQGLAPVKMKALLKMAEFKELPDSQMVYHQRAAMTNPYAPNPSVEAILHAIIPFRYVDHTHADAVITISNSPFGSKRIQEIYGPRVLIVPYVMPGFILARKVYEMTRRMDWQNCEGIVLLNHGIFTFHHEARQSYEQMIRLVTKAENYLKRKNAWVIKPAFKKADVDLKQLARIRQEVSRLKGTAMLAQLNSSVEHRHYSSIPKIKAIALRGPLTPDHIIRTKRIPALVDQKIDEDINHFSEEYRRYFKRYANASHKMLDPAPRWAVWLKRGTITFGQNIKEVKIASDIIDHTIQAVLRAQELGGWKALPEKDMFEMEYWELEQAKLKKPEQTSLLQGKIALVTGAASGIGRGCVEELHAKGAVVAAMDINPAITEMFSGLKGVIGISADAANRKTVRETVEKTVATFGGLDIVVSNAGTFPASEKICEMRDETWEKSLKVNLSAHQYLIQESIPYLSLGIDSTIIVIGSKNVPAPGPGVSAYSVAKAGLTQLARVAALELAVQGIRVNVLHPNQVFDTGIWTKDVLEKRAAHYKMSVEEYKKSNLLKTEITSKDVARMVCELAGPVFSKTTGAQIPIDGGNDRVI